MKKLLPILLLFTFLGKICFSQTESLLDSLEDNTPTTQKITGAFKSTRVINAHSIEMLTKGNMDFRILHRFGNVSDGIKQLFGLDAASMRMSFDFGILNCLTIGVGRSTNRKELDAFIKARIVQQSSGAVNTPITFVIAAGYTIVAEQLAAPQKRSIVDRSAYYIQPIVGRKFNSKFSMQLSPIFVRSNFPFNIMDDQNIIGIGGGVRYKITKRTALMLDYHKPIGNLTNATAPLSLGVDIETGGHVFQLHFSNSLGMNERAYLTQTTGNFFKGDIRFGFNLSRMFRVGHRPKL